MVQSIASVVVPGISSSLRLGLSLPLAEVVISKSVCSVGRDSIGDSMVQSIASVVVPGISSSLRLGLSLPLAEVVISKSVCSVGRDSIDSSMVQSIAVDPGISSSLGLSFRLGSHNGHQGENYEPPGRKQLHVVCRMSRAKLSPC